MFYDGARVCARAHARVYYQHAAAERIGIAMADHEPPKEWANELFMSCARLAATRSKDPNTQVIITHSAESGWHTMHDDMGGSLHC